MAEHVLTCACPQCETRFRVTREQLAVADGRVRCGACLTVFDCSDLVGQSHSADEPQSADLHEPEPETRLRDIGPTTAPEFANRSPRGSARRSADPLPAGPFAAAYAGAAGLLAVLVLGLQYPAWSQDPTLRSVYQAACAIGPCQLPPLRAIAAIDVTARSPARLPGPPATLALEVELESRAPFRQPFPILAIRTAADSRILGEQRLAPEDYLPKGHTRQMIRNRPVTVELRLHDPGSDATHYLLSVL